jgi:hypothetical protein
MRHHRLIASPMILVAILLSIAGFAARAVAYPAFAITATNVTMPGSGSASSNYSVVGIPITGTLVVSCAYSGPKTSARMPMCGGGPVDSIPVTGGQTVTGIVTFYPYGSAMPLDTKSDHQRASRATKSTVTLALAGALLFGFSFGRSRSRRKLLLALCALAILPAISGCIGNGMTPGTYPFTITAGNNGNLNPLSAGTSVTINVTVQ